MEENYWAGAGFTPGNVERVVGYDQVLRASDGDKLVVTIDSFVPGDTSYEQELETLSKGVQDFYENARLETRTGIGQFEAGEIVGVRGAGTSADEFFHSKWHDAVDQEVQKLGPRGATRAQLTEISQQVNHELVAEIKGRREITDEKITELDLVGSREAIAVTKANMEVVATAKRDNGIAWKHKEIEKTAAQWEMHHIFATLKGLYINDTADKCWALPRSPKEALNNAVVGYCKGRPDS